MPLHSAIATQLTTPDNTRIASLFIGSRDFTFLLDLGATDMQDSGSSGRSTSQFSLRTTMAAAPEITDQAMVRMVDNVNDVDLFRGFIRSRRSVSGMNPMLDLVADDIGGILDDTWIPVERRPAETMRARIGSVWGRYSGAYLSGDMGHVDALGGTLAATTFSGVTLRQAVESAIGQASSTAVYYVDPLGKLHVYEPVT